MVTKGYGFTIDDIDWSCPADLEPYAKAYELEMQHQDSQMHIMGMYNLSAMTVAVERNLAGRKAKSKYLEKPISELAKEREYREKNDRPEYDGMTEEEKQKAELERAKSYFNSLMKRF